MSLRQFLASALEVLPKGHLRNPFFPGLREAGVQCEGPGRLLAVVRWKCRSR